jgi:hypothetical protein
MNGTIDLVDGSFIIEIRLSFLSIDLGCGAARELLFGKRSLYITNEIKHIAEFHVIILVSIENKILLHVAVEGGSQLSES